MSIQTLASRIQYMGGDSLGRINKQKLQSFRAALKNDYQSRKIKTPLGECWPCLINANNLKPDYDKKILSVEFESKLEAGDTFECLDDGTHWMVYLPFLTETAYLRSEIIRCRYTYKVNGKEYWIYFQGPTETDLRWYSKASINYNILNLSGTIYIKNDENTRNYFKRFTKMKLNGHTWEVQVTDSISVPGIIELEVQEYYDNPIEELPSVEEVCCKAQIVGRTEVKQNTECGYEIRKEYYNPEYSWRIEGNPRVRIEETFNDNRTCLVKIEEGAINSFTIIYGKKYEGYSLDVNINIEDPQIIGPEVVHPYDTNVKFEVKGHIGEFWIQTDLAEIVEQKDNKCSINILTGRKGEFILYFKDEDDIVEYQLPIKIKSF